MRIEYLVVSIILLLIVLVVILALLSGASSGVRAIFDIFGKQG